MTSGLDGATAHRLRELVPRVLGAVARRSGDFAAAEDAVQDALVAAATLWPERGEPHNPGGWLFHVACRRLADSRAAERARATREAIVAAEAAEAARAPEDDAFEPVPDETLHLLFLCCHPVLTQASAIALVLRAVGGLTTAEIASAYLVPEATMAQRISRAKQAIQSAGGRFAPPDAAERVERLNAVLHVLYLVFNEGHTASSGPALVRVELSAEAIRLARLVHQQAPEHAEAAGLLALLLLTDARRAARTGPDGALIPLHEQDRTRWDRSAIAEGTALLTTTLLKGAVGSYQVQAMIAALHGEAPSIEATDWAQILALYGLLQRFADNPMVRLNRAVAVAMVHGPARGLEALRALEGDPRLAGSHRLDAVRGHFYEMLGDRPAAIRHYRAAAERAANLLERHYLAGKAAQLQ